MKKLAIAILVLLTIGSSVQAQGTDQRGGGARMGEMMKQRLKDELKFSDVKADSVTAIQMEFQAKNRQMRDQNLSEDERKTKMDTYNGERKARLKTILTAEEMQKLEDYLENMRKMRQQRQQ